jgi:hypothetical protein
VNNEYTETEMAIIASLEITAKDAFQYISKVNYGGLSEVLNIKLPKYSNDAEEISGYRIADLRAILPSNTLASKIINSDFTKLSDKQIWVIAYEMMKSNECKFVIQENKFAKNKIEIIKNYWKAQASLTF